MSKGKTLLVALALGAGLGVLDGLTAWFTPEARVKLGQIVMYSTMKDVMAGFLIGLSAMFIRSKPAVALIGLSIGFGFAYWVAAQPDPDTGKHYWVNILVPGTLVGLITGYATAKFGGSKIT